MVVFMAGYLPEHGESFKMHAEYRGGGALEHRAEQLATFPLFYPKGYGVGLLAV